LIVLIWTANYADILQEWDGNVEDKIYFAEYSAGSLAGFIFGYLFHYYLYYIVIIN